MLAGWLCVCTLVYKYLGIPSKRHQFESQNRFRMRAPIFVFVTLLLFISTQSAPQYGGQATINSDRRPSRPSQGGLNRPTFHQNNDCKTDIQTVTVTEYEEKTEEVCEDQTREQCDILSERQCTKRQERHCRPHTERKCATKYRQQCRQVLKPVQVPYQDEDCSRQPVRICEQIWVEVGYNEKKWADDPNNCKNDWKKECHQVEKYRTEHVPDKQCSQVPWEDCQDVRSEKCEFVTKNDCHDVPRRHCYQVPHRACRQAHRRIPHLVTKRIPVKSCRNRNGDWEVISKISNDAAEHDAETISVRKEEVEVDRDHDAVNF